MRLAESGGNVPHVERTVILKLSDDSVGKTRIQGYIIRLKIYVFLDDLHLIGMIEL